MLLAGDTGIRFSGRDLHPPLRRGQERCLDLVDTSATPVSSP